MDAQVKVCKVSYQNMFKTIQNQANVIDKSSEDFKEISEYIVNEGFKADSGKVLIAWIQESNPSFNVELYKKLMLTIEHKRDVFLDDQKVLIDKHLTYTNLLTTAPSKWFIDKELVFAIDSITNENDFEIFNN